MPDLQSLMAGLWLLAVAALAGLALLLLARRPLPGAPLVVHLLAIGLCLFVLLALKLDGWPDLKGRVLKGSLGLLVAWLAVTLAAFARPGREAPLAEAFATAGARLYAGFFIGVGAASLRHYTPLVPPLAWGAVLFGLSLLLVPALARPLPSTGRRVAALLAIILLLAAGYHARMG
jgi:hypothetical protein